MTVTVAMVSVAMVSVAMVSVVTGQTGTTGNNASWDVLIVALCVAAWILAAAGLAAALNARDRHRNHP